MNLSRSHNEQPGVVSTTREKSDITIAKGIGIVLVVVGHILSHSQSQGNDWFKVLTELIYYFHMPFFMYLSGYVFFRPGRLADIRRDYAAFTSRQTVRLLLPVVVVGVGIVVLKLIVSKLAFVDNVPTNFLDGLRDLFVTTDRSPSRFVWYIFSLYIYNLLCPPLWDLLKERMWLWLALAMVVYFVPYIPVFYLGDVTHNFVFFVIGGLLRHSEAQYLPSLDRRVPVWLLVFATTLGLSYVYAPTDPLWRLVVGVSAIPALHAISRILASGSDLLSRALIVLGHSTYSIYLFNTLAIGAAKGVVFKITDWNGLNFLWVMPMLVIAGLVLPLAAEALVFKRVPFIRRNILGIG